MSSKRRQRRAEQKRRFKLLQGGASDARASTIPAPPPGAEELSPPGRLARDLDRFISERCVRDAELTPPTVLAVLLQLAAGLTAELDAPSADVMRALDVFIDREREARGKG